MTQAEVVIDTLDTLTHRHTDTQTHTQTSAHKVGKNPEKDILLAFGLPAVNLSQEKVYEFKLKNLDFRVLLLSFLLIYASLFDHIVLFALPFCPKCRKILHFDLNRPTAKLYPKR